MVLLLWLLLLLLLLLLLMMMLWLLLLLLLLFVHVVVGGRRVILSTAAVLQKACLHPPDTHTHKRTYARTSFAAELVASPRGRHVRRRAARVDWLHRGGGSSSSRVAFATAAAAAVTWGRRPPTDARAEQSAPAAWRAARHTRLLP